MFQSGDQIIYRITKCTSCPGRRATDVSPEPRGEHYVYDVDKFWVVAKTFPDGTLLLETRRGKQHIVAADDDRLRRPNLWERFVYRRRFPHPSKQNESSGPSGVAHS
jgi:hypothetical protein